MNNRLSDLEQQLLRVKQASQSPLAEAKSEPAAAMAYSSIFSLEQEISQVKRWAQQETFSEAKVLTYRQEFENDVEAFLRKYAVSVWGTVTNAANSGGGTVAGLIPGTFAGLQGSTFVSLIAPRVYAHFSLRAAADNPNYIPISAEEVQIKFDNDAINGLPMYLIPYEQGRSLGVKLPSGNNVAYAITATLNGCTVEISGSDTEPYVSHSNVKNVTHANSATQLANRQTAMTARLTGLKTDFANAETAAGNVVPGVNNVNNPHHNALNFAFYANHATPPGYPGITVDYRADVQQAVTNLAAGTPPTTKKGTRVETSLISHTRYMLTLTQHALTASQNPANPPNAIILAKRSAGNPGRWTFYYQESTRLEFDVSEKAKVGPKLVVGNTPLSSTKWANVVMNSGKLWSLPVTQNFVQL